MIRRLFTAASAVSLLLCVSAAGLWVRAHFTADRICIDWWTEDTKAATMPSLDVFHGSGSTWIRYCRTQNNIGERDWWHRSTLTPSAYRSLLDFYSLPPVNKIHRGRISARIAGFEYVLHDHEGGLWSVTLPDYVLTISFAVAPLLWMGSALRRKRRRAEGRCL